jgi:hypothetical protein
MFHFSLAPLCPLVIWLLLVGFFLSICLATHDGIQRLKRLHQIPCSRCAFYTGDYRLKCAVHPCKALSEEAIACVDYESNLVLARVRLPVITIKTGRKRVENG